MARFKLPILLVVEAFKIFKKNWHKDLIRIILGILAGFILTIFKLISFIVLTEKEVLNLGILVIGLDLFLVGIYIILHLLDKYNIHNKIITKVHNTLVSIIEDALYCQKNSIILLAGICIVYEMKFNMSFLEAFCFYLCFTAGYYLLLGINNAGKIYLESKNV